jgi:hypothetical protein
MTEQQDDDAKTCGICSEPFKDGDIAVQAAQYQMWPGPPLGLIQYGQ